MITHNGNRRDRSGGFSTIELIMVLMILVMLVVTVFTMIYAGQDSYMYIHASREATINTRDALAYVDMRIRQNDRLGGAVVKVCPLTGENAVYIEDFESPDFCTWIYFYEGKLLEYYNVTGQDPVPGDSTVIAELADFSVQAEAHSIISKTATYVNPRTGEANTISSSVAMRALR